MISTLKKKFVLSTSILLFVFVMLLITAINGFNFYTTTKYVDGIIDMINTNNGGKPNAPIGEQGGFRPISERSLANTKYFSVRINAQGEIVDVNVSNVDNVTQDQAIAYAKDVLSKNKTSGYVDDFRYKLTSMNIGKGGMQGMEPPSGMQEPPQNTEDTQNTQDSQNTQEPPQNMGQGGFSEGFEPKEGEKILTFFDWYEQKTSLISGIALSYVIGGIGMAIVVILLIAFSRKAVDPISDSITAQKEFITNVSHEIKTPLTVISGDVDILKMSGVDNEWLDNIKEQVQKSKFLVDDLVLLSKMNEENITLSFEKFDFSDFVDESVATFYSVAETRDLTISSDIQKDVLINGNKQALGELVSILLENALKYCDSQGKITLQLFAQGKSAILKISNDYKDDVSEEHLQKMFDRYFRTRKAQENHDGSGIGLSIAKAITVAHHGEIKAEHTDGKMIITASLGVIAKTQKQQQEEE